MARVFRQFGCFAFPDNIEPVVGLRIPNRSKSQPVQTNVCFIIAEIHPTSLLRVQVYDNGLVVKTAPHVSRKHLLRHRYESSFCIIVLWNLLIAFSVCKSSFWGWLVRHYDVSSHPATAAGQRREGHLFYLTLEQAQMICLQSCQH